MEDASPTEDVREALTRLYDPTALAALPLATQLVTRGALRSPDGLYDLLLASIDRLKPPDGAPSRSHGWRCYRYLFLRYVECTTNESIAREFGVSARHAARVHLDAIGALTRLLVPPHRLPVSPSSPRERKERAEGTLHPVSVTSDAIKSPLEAELAAVGRQPPEGMVDVANVTRSIAETLSQVTVQHGVRLDLQFPDQLPPVRVNRVCLRQIILNVLLYLSQSVREGTVLAVGEPTADAVIVILRGRPGLRDVVPGAPNRDGRPAVLATAKQLARLQRIILEEDETTPLTFRLRLPVGVTRTVLLVDDNPDVGELFRRLLDRSPYHLTHCRTADRALQLARTNAPDVIVLDIVLPSTDGWEILTALRGDPRTAEIPVVVCSVLPDQEVALSLKVADFVAKPVSQGTLLSALDRACNQLRDGTLPSRGVGVEVVSGEKN